MRASLPSPSTSCACTIATARGRGEREPDQRPPGLGARAIPRAGELGLDQRASRGIERLVPAAHRVVVVRARVDDARARRGARSGAALSGSSGSKPNCSTTIPGSPSDVAQPLDRRGDHAEVLGDQRQRAPSSRRGGVEQRAARARAASDPPRRVARVRGHRPVGDEAAEVVDPRQVEELERAPQPLDPPAIAAPLQRRPVVQRVAPQLALVGVGVRAARRPRTPVAEQLGVRAVVGAVRRDVDRRRRRYSRTPRSAAYARSADPLALEAHLVGDARRAAAKPLPVLDPVAPGARGSRAPRPSTRGARGSASRPGQAGERRARLVRRAVAVRRAERQHLPPRLPGGGQPVDEAVRLAARARPPGSEVGCAAGRRSSAAGAFTLSGQRGRAGLLAAWCRILRGEVPDSTAQPTAGADPDPVPGSPPSTAAATRPSAASATRSTVSADIFRDGHDMLRAVVRYRGPGDRRWRESAMRPVDAAARRRPLGGRASRSTPGPLAVHDRGLDRRVRHLARRARAQDRGRPARPRRRAVRGRRCSLRAALERATTKRGPGAARGTRWPRSRIRRSPRPRSTTLALGPELFAAVERGGERHGRTDADGAAADRGRPRARPLRRLVRAVPALVGRPEGRREARCRGSPSSASTSSTCRRSTRSACTNRKGRNNALTAAPERPGLAVGDRRARRAATTRSTPSSARSTTCAALTAAPPSTDMDIALDFAIQCSADHPWLTEHPEWFHRRPDGTLKYAENPPKRYQDIYNVNWESRGLARPLAGAARRRAALGRLRREGLPRRQPAHQAVRVLGVADRRGPRVDRDVVFLAEAFTRRAVMRQLAKIGFSQSYTYFTWKNSRWELTEYVDGARLRRRAGVLPAELLRQHAGHPPRLPPARRPGRRSRRGSCWPPRSARATASTPASSTSRTMPRARGLRGVPALREVRDQAARARRPAAAADPARERDPAREPGAAAARRTSPSWTPPTTR